MQKENELSYVHVVPLLGGSSKVSGVYSEDGVASLAFV